MATNIDLNDFDESGWHPETLGVRAGNQMTEFGENSEALFLNSSFRFKNAAQAAARFGGHRAWEYLFSLHQSNCDNVSR